LIAREGGKEDARRTAIPRQAEVSEGKGGLMQLLDRAFFDVLRKTARSGGTGIPEKRGTTIKFGH